MSLSIRCFAVALVALLLAACGEYASADWPSLSEGFDYTPTQSPTTPVAPLSPPPLLEPEAITTILADSNGRFEASQARIHSQFAAYDQAFGTFKTLSGEAAGRAWLSVQLALSRVSQAADSLTLVERDLRRAEAQAGERGADLQSLLSDVSAYKMAISERLQTERGRLQNERPE